MPPTIPNPQHVIQKSWKLGKTGRLEGSREKVKALIAEQTGIPDAEREYLQRKIDSRPAAHNWIIILAHCQEHPNKSVLDLDIESSTENI